MMPHVSKMIFEELAIDSRIEVLKCLIFCRNLTTCLP